MPSHKTPVAFYSPKTYRSEDSVGWLMKRIMGSIIQQVDRQLDVHGLTSAQWGPLLHLHRHGPTAVAELARIVQVDAGSMTRLLDRLEKKDLCKRVRSTADRRVVQVEITPQGEAAITEVPGVLADVMNAHLAGFSKSEWQALTGYLQRMLATGEALRSADRAAS